MAHATATVRYLLYNMMITREVYNVPIYQQEDELYRKDERTTLDV
jgi:hypothetical protein